MLFTTVVFVLVLSLLVLVHEFGHFWAAKNRGIIPVEFGLGLPSRVWCIYKATDGTWKKVWGNKEITDAADTIYSINWLIFGGFVNLLEDEDDNGDPNHFSKKKIWERGMILLAGVTMNIVLAVVLYSVGFMIGLPQSVDPSDQNAIVSERQIIIEQVIPDTPAEKADLKTGDVVMSINGTQVLSTEEIIKYVDGNRGQTLLYKIKRGNEVIEKNIIPEDIGNNRSGIGIGISEVGIVKYPFFIAIWKGFLFTFLLVWKMIVAFYLLIKGLVLGTGLEAEVGGPVMIANYVGQAARLGIGYLINLTALLSINLAILNALPFPALDGGRVLFLVIEKIKGGPVNKKIENTVNTLGMVLLLLLMAIVTFKDVLRLFQ